MAEMTSLAVGATTENQQFLHLKAIKFEFSGAHPDCNIEVEIMVDGEFKESRTFSRSADITWEKDLYISSANHVVLTIRKIRLGFRPKYATITVNLNNVSIRGGGAHKVSDDDRKIQAILTFGTSLDSKHALDLLGGNARLALANKVAILDKIAKISAFAEKVIEIAMKAVELGSAISGVNSIAKAAFDTAALAFKKLQQQRDCHRAAVDLLETITSKLPFADIIPENMRSPQIRASLQAMLGVIEQAMRFLVKYAQAPSHKDLLSSRLGTIGDLKEKLKEVLEDFHVSLSVQQLVAMQETNERVKEANERVKEANERAEEANKLAKEQQQTGALKKLNPVAAAQFSQGNSCMEGTRETPLEQIMTWTEGAAPSATFWVHGIAGSGKSTIAATVCEQLKAKGTLAGAYFCKRDVPYQRDPKRILPTLSSMLTKVHEPYRDLVAKALEQEEDISASPLAYQLLTLFVTPFENLQPHKGQPVIFVIDALDECDDKLMRSQIIECLNHIATLSSWLKVFVTSRPLPEFVKLFNSSQSPAITVIDLNEVDAESDIFLYTKSRLEALAEDERLDERWFHDDALRRLAKKASGLFIWARTVFDFVADEYDVNEALDAILAGSGDDESKSSLDSLYKTVIQTTRGGKGRRNMSFLKAVLGTIRATAKNKPLSIDGLYDFMPPGLGIEKDVLGSILKDLRSVLYEDASKGNVIRVCHPSFLDFLENHGRCGEYWTNPDQIDQTMAEKCLNIMRAGLRFNICDLKSSYVANEGIPDLQQRVHAHIPESLQYSCLYWTTYFIRADRKTVDELVSDFFRGLQVLYWLEVLSLIGDLRNGLNALEVIADIYHTQKCEIARDMHRFLSFTYDAINYSTPHLYISAMTWLPEKSPLRLLLHAHFESQPLVAAGRHREWHRARWVNAMDDGVNQVAFTPDGRYVAACSDDKSIAIWEARSGTLVTKLRGHVGAVWSIAFSPNGRQLVSGSRDESVRIWDVDTRRAIGEALIGHTNTIDSVCYSPDRKFIASRSYDETVRIWDSDSGKEVRKLAGQSGRGCVVYSPDGRKLACCGKEGIKVYYTESGELLGEVRWDSLVNYTVAWSPKGTYLASGGGDFTVRIWDGETLVEVAVLRKHTSYVYSVAFSPDGNELVSASADATLIRWDMSSFQMINAPLRAHETTINSVVYSSDGLFIASGSGDNSVRLWDADSIFNADSHLSCALALACSPNGKEFASASANGSVRIHDVYSSAVLRTLAGHSDPVWTLAYNSNGMLLASGSNDHTIIIWDAETGTEQQKLEGHTALVTSIVFTLDGQHVISASNDCTVRCWPIIPGDGGKVLVTHPDKVKSVCLSSDGKLLASGGRDNTIRFSDPETGTDIGQRCTSDGVIRALAFSPDGKYVASSSENAKIQIWDVDSRTEVRSLEGHTDYVLSVTFSHDGKQILSSSGDATIRQWDLETGAELRKLTGHTDAIMSAICSIDERQIISASDDGTVRTWNSDATQKGYVAELDQELPSLPLVEGWIKSREGELFIWVPPEYRNGIRDMCEICIPADAPGHPIRLDWSKLVKFKGEEWTSIFKDANSQA